MVATHNKKKVSTHIIVRLRVPVGKVSRWESTPVGKVLVENVLVENVLVENELVENELVENVLVENVLVVNVNR